MIEKSTLTELPSATTAVFVLIVGLSLMMFIAVGAGLDETTCITIPMMIIVVLSSIRLFLNTPSWLINKYTMQPLEDLNPDFARSINNWAAKVGLQEFPVLLYTDAQSIRLQTFGTFRQKYVVVNRKELIAAQRQNALEALETMFVHELAHIKNGDVWKLQLSKQIFRVYFVFTIWMAIAGPLNLYPVWTTGDPGETAGDIVGLVIFPVLIGLMYYLLRLMQDIREHYADAMAESILGSERIISASVIAETLWNEDTREEAYAPSSSLPSLPNESPGLNFIPRGNTARKRLDALVVGAPFHTSMQHVLFAGGVATGLPIFALSYGGLFSIFTGGLFGGIYLILCYLLPYIASKNRIGLQVLKRCVLSVGVFIGGMVSTFAFFTGLEYLVMRAVKLETSLINSQILGYLDIYLSIVVPVGVMLIIFLFLAIPVLGLLYQAKRYKVIPHSWNFRLALIPLSITFAIIAIYSEVISLFFINTESVGLERLGYLVELTILSVLLIVQITLLLITSREIRKKRSDTNK